MRLSVIEGLRSASKQGALGKALPGGAQAIWTEGGTLPVGLTGAQLPPPGPSPSTEKERKRVDVYIRKYTLESTDHKRRLPPSGVGGFHEQHGIGSEVGSFGTRWVHIYTERSHMAQDHF